MKYTLPLCVVALTVAVTEPQFADAANGMPRIGIISDAGARAEADLLLIELQKAKCEMVERDEIGKVLKEQAFQASFNRTDVQRIGRLLKADGLVLISASRTGQMSFDSALIEGSTKLLTSFTNQTLTVRLVAVAPGVLTWFAESPVGASDWAATTAATLAGFFPKLSVNADAATPVSLLRVRPTNGFASSIRLADALSPLLWQRLAREPSLFVLDRENLPHVVEEAQWNGQEPGFWAGSVLVEGRASHDLANTNQCLFTLTVQRPVAGTNTYTRTEWTEAGGLTDLPGLVERAAVRLRQEIGTGSNKVPWDPRAEGQRLLAIVPHLVDPRQQKAALGTAMSLGCRDIKTANDYRVALRSIAYRDAVRFSDVRIHLALGAELEQQARDFLGLIRFHNDYRPPGGFDPNYRSDWHSSQESAWLFSYFQPLKDIETFFDAVKGAKREGGISAVIQEIQAACRETARRLLVIDPYYQKFQQGQIPLHNARYRYTTMREILDTYRRWMFPPRTNDNYNAIGSTAGLWSLERQRAEPVFPDARTESAAERDRLWQEFQQELADSDRPDLRLNILLRRIREEKNPDQRRDFRGRLQTLIAEYRPLFLGACRSDSLLYVWSAAYPGWQHKEGHFSFAGSPNDPTTRGELRANARHAYETLLAVTPKNTLRPDDIEGLIHPHISLLTEEEVRNVYRLTREFHSPCEGIVNCSYQGVVDAFAIQTWLGAQFPSVLDDEYMAELARRNAPSPLLKVNPVIVQKTIPLLSDQRREPVWIRTADWRAGKLWVLWENDCFVVDPVTETSERIAPPPEEPYAGVGRWGPSLWTTDGLLFFLKAFEIEPNSDRTGTWMAYRPVTGGVWRVERLLYAINSVARVKGKFYFTTSAPRIVVYQGGGLIEYDPQTKNSVTLRTPGTPYKREKRPGPPQPIQFEDLEFGHGATNGLLVGTANRKLFGWDPDTKQVQELTPNPPRQTKPAPLPLKWVNTSSHAFGFDIAIDQNFGNIRLEQLPPGLPATHQLYLVRNGSSAPEAVPLRFPRLPKGLPPAYHRIDPNREWPDVYGPAFAGPTSLLVPYDSKRAFHVVPYADIQRWFATNAPPVATTNVSTTSNPSTTQGR